MTAICSGGKAPAGATLERYARDIDAAARRRGGGVPGLVDAWEVFADRWCTMPLHDLLHAGDRYARDGFPVSRELGLSC